MIVLKQHVHNFISIKMKLSLQLFSFTMNRLLFHSDLVKILNIKQNLTHKNC
jgi:hypothetical protein